MIRPLLSLAVLCILFPAVAFSSGCDKAHSKVEQLICANPKLSDFDNLLEETSVRILKGLSAKEGQHLVSEQKLWQKNIRNQCTDDACLMQAYQEKIDELDPIADQNLTCEKMRKYPEKIFDNAGPDLGSGSTSPVSVDFECPDSLSELPFMKNLLETAKTIHGEPNSPYCGGTLDGSLWRYYEFRLTKAGIAPQTIQNDLSFREPPDHRPTSAYFQQWSEQSLYNYRLYSKYQAERSLVATKLVEYYQKEFDMPEVEAKEITNKVLLLIIDRAAGTFPLEQFSLGSRISALVSEPSPNIGRLRNMLADEANPPSRYEIYAGLKTALLKELPTEYIQVLMARLSKNDIKELSSKGEPLLSFALGKQRRPLENIPDLFVGTLIKQFSKDEPVSPSYDSRYNLLFLLSRGVPVNAENEFGKTVLFYAIGSNDRDAVWLLLSFQADVNHAYKSAAELKPTGEMFFGCGYPTLTHTKRTPLMHAAQNSDVDMIRLLISHGADVNAVDEVGLNALDYARMGKNQKNMSYLQSLGLKSSTRRGRIH